MKTKITIMVVAVSLLVLVSASIYTQTNTSPIIQPTPTTTPTPTPQPKPLKIDVKVTPWGDMYRKQPDCKEDYNVELVYPKQNENFTTNTFNVTFNAGAFFWVIQKAYYASDLFSGERWIDTFGNFNQYSIDLQKTFTFNLTNVPEGENYLKLTVAFHDGTRSNSTAFFRVLI